MSIPNQNIALTTEYYVETVVGKTFDEEKITFRQDDSAAGPFIDTWDEATYGAKPELSTVMAQEAAALASKAQEEADTATEVSALDTFMRTNGLTKRALREWVNS